ncbi:MAG: hypothetical protein Q4G62_03115 [Pseudomonadota bacterium]|nr:hypothetical protein [Pseudomonadota bacterium]
MFAPIALTLALAGPVDPEQALAEFCPASALPAAVTGEWLNGRYRVVGYDATRQHAYHGSLTVHGEEDSQVLQVSRQIEGQNGHGTARMVACGPDRVRQVEVRFNDGPSPRHLFCVLHTDYDNNHRLSCTRPVSDPAHDVETWFQQTDG